MRPMANIKKQLKQIEREQDRLSKEREALIDREKRIRELYDHIDNLIRETKTESPRSIIESLAHYYQIKLPSSSPKGIMPHRKRTRVTPYLRDKIKAMAETGLSINKIAKEKNISYIVVAKMIKGEYDSLT